MATAAVAFKLDRELKHRHWMSSQRKIDTKSHDMLEMFDFSKMNFGFGYLPWSFATFQRGVGSTGSKKRGHRVTQNSWILSLFCAEFKRAPLKPLNFP